MGRAYPFNNRERTFSEYCDGVVSQNGRTERSGKTERSKNSFLPRTIAELNAMIEDLYCNYYRYSQYILA